MCVPGVVVCSDFGEPHFVYCNLNSVTKMRRSEFLVTDPKLINPVLESAESGCVAMIDTDGSPYATQVNLMWFDRSLWFHSSNQGKKIQLIRSNPEVFVSVVLASSFVPSYATDPDKPCNATQFFRSVHLKGKAYLVDDLETKILVMQGMMQKMQPEGRHMPMQDAHKSLGAMALVQLKPEEITGKFKFGQNLSGSKKEGLIKTLQKSKDPRAQEALSWIKNLSEGS